VFFPNEFYQELGLELAPVAANLETFFRRQNEIFGDLSVRRSGDALPQFHVEIDTVAAEPVKLVTLTARRGKANNPDVQFGRIADAFPSLDSGAYRREVLGRLAGLIGDAASTDAACGGRPM
jgi:hypothetical protein